MVELYCSVCEDDQEMEWDFFDAVCSKCGTVFETDWETDSDDNIYGPWIVSIAKEED